MRKSESVVSINGSAIITDMFHQILLDVQPVNWYDLIALA
jgi:hypothetical protein